MAEIEANGVRLYHEVQGEGPPLVLVHGSWVNGSSWQALAPLLADSFTAVTYDRRGHSRSERPDTRGSVHEDADDLAALIEALELAPAHVVTSSYGGNFTLRLAAKRPELFRTLSCHEPPLWSLLAGDPEGQEALERGRGSIESVGARIAQGDHEGAARQFVEEVAFGPGAWENELPPPVRATFVENAPTFLDELRDPDQLAADVEALRTIDVPLRFTQGTESPPTFSLVIDRLVEAMPQARRETIEGAGHVPHLTHPEPYAERIRAFAGQEAVTP
jgi:pimeloyl-ACP methyl ester carboxylesterase